MALDSDASLDSGPGPASAAGSAARLSRRLSVRSTTSTVARPSAPAVSWSPWVPLPSNLLVSVPPPYVIASQATRAATASAGRRVSLNPAALDAVNAVLDEVVLRVVLGARSLNHERIRAHGLVPLLRHPPTPPGQPDMSTKAAFARELLIDAELALKAHETQLRTTRGFAPLGLAAASRWDGADAFPVGGSYTELRQQACYYCDMAHAHRGHKKSPSDPPPPPRDTRIPVFPTPPNASATPSSTSISNPPSTSGSHPSPVGREQTTFVHLTPQSAVYVGAVLAGMAKSMIRAVGECVSERIVLRSDLEPTGLDTGSSTDLDSDSVVSLDAELVSEHAGLNDLSIALSQLSTSVSPVFIVLDSARQLMGLEPLPFDRLTGGTAHESSTFSRPSVRDSNSLDKPASSSSVYSTRSGRGRPWPRPDSAVSNGASITSAIQDGELPVPFVESDIEASRPASPTAPPSSFAFPHDKETGLHRRASSGTADSRDVARRVTGLAGKVFGLRPHSRRRSSSDSTDAASLFHLGAIRSTSALSTRPESLREPSPGPAPGRVRPALRARSASSASVHARAHSRDSVRSLRSVHSRDPAPELDGAEFDALLAAPTLHVSLTPDPLKGQGTISSVSTPHLPLAAASSGSSGPISVRTRSRAPPPSSYSFRTEAIQDTPLRKPKAYVRHLDLSSQNRPGTPDGVHAPVQASNLSPNHASVVGLELPTTLAPALPATQLTEGAAKVHVGIALTTPVADNEKEIAVKASANKGKEGTATDAQVQSTASRLTLDVSKADHHTQTAPAPAETTDDAAEAISSVVKGDNASAHSKSPARPTSLAEARQQAAPGDTPSKVVPWGYRSNVNRNRQRRYSLDDASTREFSGRVGLGGRKFPPVSNAVGLSTKTSSESVKAVTSMPVSSPDPSGGVGDNASEQSKGEDATDTPARPVSSADRRRPMSMLSGTREVRSSHVSSQAIQQMQLQHTMTVLEEILAQTRVPGNDARQVVEDKLNFIRAELKSLQTTNTPSQPSGIVPQSNLGDKGQGTLKQLSLAPSAPVTTVSPKGRRPMLGHLNSRSSLIAPSRCASPSPITSPAGTTAPTPAGSGLVSGPALMPPTAEHPSQGKGRSVSVHHGSTEKSMSTPSPSRMTAPKVSGVTGSPDPVKPDPLSSSPDPKRTSLSPLPSTAFTTQSGSTPASPQRQGSRPSYPPCASRLSVWSSTSGRTSPSISSLPGDGDGTTTGTPAPPTRSASPSGFNTVRVPQAALKAQIERDRAVQTRVLASLFGQSSAMPSSNPLPSLGETSIPTVPSLQSLSQVSQVGSGGGARSRLSTISAQSVPVTGSRNCTSPPLVGNRPVNRPVSRPRAKTDDGKEPRNVGAGIGGGGGRDPPRAHSPLLYQGPKQRSNVFERAARAFSVPSKR